eukprot:CAMPEP_0203761706 /NCGR_PEP_ID=MMETSP0098-20131031/14744_1 /ASSEMBLY_ACC=CAM_ASM_000208 /TAXON_ID=96639 /ORGANISM=" , Strain NY0313808BC1" /LENGTH=479 /DNA_ID=CAMNT_0050655819 /DNA_START=271 /DNA_END=1710 /DNA_ORIENTATION=-
MKVENKLEVDMDISRKGANIVFEDSDVPTESLPDNDGTSVDNDDTSVDSSDSASDREEVSIGALEGHVVSDIPQAPGVSVVNGRLSNAHFAENREQIVQRFDLPRIFKEDVRNWESKVQSRIPVCVFTRTPRQDSLFSTNVFSMFGSSKYNYQVLRSTDCQHTGTCSNGSEARTHPKCDPSTTPTIHLLERIKNFQHERFEQVLTNGLESYDVLVATGDEFCRANGTHGRAHFRMYSGPLMTNSSESSPIYLPLGPREEFRRITEDRVRLVAERQYMFNFIGSLTSPCRRKLVTEVKKFKSRSGKSKALTGFVHIISKWSKKLTKQNGYILPAQYQEILLKSVFTLCPQGHNPEAYRIYEAIEAGSIPIVVLDEFYRQHECDGALSVLVRQGAPFIFLNSWSELGDFLERMLDQKVELQKIQADVRSWYSRFMTKVALQFEKVLELRFDDRMATGDFVNTNTVPSVKTKLQDPNYLQPL